MKDSFKKTAAIRSGGWNGARSAIHTLMPVAHEAFP